VSTIRQDLVYGLRMLAKKPVFTAAAVLSLALGIGLNTAIFTLINTILLGRLPFQEENRLAAVWSVPPQHLDKTDYVSIPDFVAFRDQNHSFELLGAVNPNMHDFGAVENGAPAERLIGEDFTPELLQSLGVQPFMGRLLMQDEGQVDHPAPVLILGYRLWQRRFGGDRNVLGKTILVDGIQNTIIGVMKPDFVFDYDKAEYIVPLRMNRTQLRGSARFLLVAGRLKRGVSMAQAQHDLEPIAQQLARTFPRDMEQGKPWTVRVQPIREGLFGFMKQPLLLLQGAVAFVLLIASANVAALLLARASSRHTEVAIRAALGAGRARIFRQFLTESAMLSLLGGVFGVVLAWWGVRALVAMAPAWFPRLHETAIDGRVLLFTISISLLTGLIFGLAPALHSTKSAFVDSLKDGMRGGSTGGFRSRLRSALVSAQLALALVLLIGSGLLIRSFLKIQGADLGCDPTGLLTFDVRLPPPQFQKAVSAYHGFPLWETAPAAESALRQIFERIQSLPGVQSAAGSAYTPLILVQATPFEIVGRPVAPSDQPSADYYPVTPNFFQTMKIALRRGRDFSSHDTASAPWVAIVNETLARRFWPNEDPLGKHIHIDLSPDDQPREVIAVVHDIPSNPRQKSQQPAIFVPYFQAGPRTMGPLAFTRLRLAFLLRTQGDPMRLLPAVQRAVAEIDPNRPLTDPRTLESHLADQLQYPRYYSMLIGLFAFVATLLAAVGIYGVMAYAIEQRTREIGIRMALGAGRGNVLRLVLRQAVWTVAGGIVFGLAGAAALTRFISSQLWEVQSTDPATFLGVSVLLTTVAVFACVVPTRRAVRVDPTIALRYE
jgi:putative ABC transport system permease protein